MHNMFKTTIGLGIRVVWNKEPRGQVPQLYVSNNEKSPNKKLIKNMPTFNTRNGIESARQNRFTYQKYPQSILNSYMQQQYDRNIKIDKNMMYSIQYQANNKIQDRIVTGKLLSINADIACVFDGHGGSALSQFCQQNMVNYIDKFIEQKKQKNCFEIEKIIKQSLILAHKQLDKDFYQKIYNNNQNNLGFRKIKNVGTCALTIIIYNKNIYVANCGDSEAIVVSSNQQKIVMHKDLNQRLSANNQKERERLKAKFEKDKDIVQKVNGCFYVKGRLQPTYALGDYFLKQRHLYKDKENFNGPYIINQPKISVYPIMSNYKAIVLGSDGIWDFIDKKVVAQISLKQKPHEQILARTLEQIAKIHKKSVSEIKEVCAQEKRGYHDDISIIVVKLNQKYSSLTANTQKND